MAGNLGQPSSVVKHSRSTRQGPPDVTRGPCLLYTIRGASLPASRVVVKHFGVPQGESRVACEADRMRRIAQLAVFVTVTATTIVYAATPLAAGRY